MVRVHANIRHRVADIAAQFSVPTLSGEPAICGHQPHPSIGALVAFCVNKADKVTSRTCCGAVFCHH